MNTGRPTYTAPPRQQGLALLVVLAILTVMVTVALEMNRQGRNAVLASAAGSRHVQISQMHESGLQAAMAILIADRLASDTDSLQEEWADNEAVGQRIGVMVPFEQGRLSVEIRDELGRLQVNALVQRPGSPQTRPDHVQVGEGAVKQSRFLHRREDRHWTESDEWRSLFLAALTELTQAKRVELRLVTGLPVAFYADRQAVRDRLLGDHRVQRENRHAQTLQVSDCRIIPQPFGRVVKISSFQMISDCETGVVFVPCFQVNLATEGVPDIVLLHP